MEQQKEFPRRKKNRLDQYDYSSCGAYFVTICTKDRRNIFFAKDQPDFVGEDIILPSDSVRLSLYGKVVNDSIALIPKSYPHIELLQYVIMPNHVHLILFITSKDGRIISSPTDKKSISTVVGQLKRNVSKKIGIAVWQRSFHDHIIRGRDDYEKISKYIYNNPVTWQYDCFYNAE